MNGFKRINYKAENKNSSMTIDKTLFELIEAYNGEASKWCREQAIMICQKGTVPGKISAAVRESAINLVADPRLLKKMAKK
jgi:hypothetical protein